MGWRGRGGIAGVGQGLRPFQEYFTYIEPIVHRRWAKIGEPGEKPLNHPYAELGFPTCDRANLESQH